MSTRSAGRHFHRIDLRDPFEVGFFCARFGCSRDQLFAAAKIVGSMRDDLREYFASHPPQRPPK